MVLNYSGVVQLAAHQPLELGILVRVQAPEPTPRPLDELLDSPHAPLFAFIGAAIRLPVPLPLLGG